MAAVLSADMQTTDKVVINIEEAREMGLSISPPDVNRGGFRFVADSESSIIYGLGAIKGLGEGPVDAIVNARASGGPFTDLFDLCERVDARKVNKRAVEALIGCGALDQLVPVKDDGVADTIDYRRALLFANYEDAVKIAEQKARNADSGLTDLFGEDMLTGRSPGMRYNHFETFSCMTFKDRLQREKDTLGLYLTGHPLDPYKAELCHLAGTRIADLRVSKDEQRIVGLIVDLRTMKNKKGDTIAFITLDDKSGRMEVAVFADLYAQYHARLHKDAIVVVKGTTAADDFTGGVRMRATEILDLSEARQLSVKRLKLRLDGQCLGHDFVSELQEILIPYRESAGQGCPVYVNYQRLDAKGDIVLGDNWRVVPDDDLIQNLRDHYGTEMVQLDY
ncbi:MAG: OB-fold nucleic acid binding domain-containing protein, partial [Pseudomonadales bacterium]